MNAYNELYLDDARNNFADMIEIATVDYGYDPDAFLSWFITSGIAQKFENGNPKYIVGMSGEELFYAVLNKVNVPYKAKDSIYHNSKGPEYWAGWILAYYQWYTAMRFEDIANNGLPLSKIISMYIYHEADESKFITAADEIIKVHKTAHKSKLQLIRKARGITQQQLSDISGVSLRMIQLYEQKQNDINKAGVNVIVNISKALGCGIEDLLE